MKNSKEDEKYGTIKDYVNEANCKLRLHLELHRRSTHSMQAIHLRFWEIWQIFVQSELQLFMDQQIPWQEREIRPNWLLWKV